MFSRGLRPFDQDSDVGIKPWGTVTISSARTQNIPRTLSCVLLEAVVALAFAYLRMTRQPRLEHIALVHSFIDLGFGTSLTYESLNLRVGGRRVGRLTSLIQFS